MFNLPSYVQLNNKGSKVMVKTSVNKTFSSTAKTGANNKKIEKIYILHIEIPAKNKIPR